MEIMATLLIAIVCLIGAIMGVLLLLALAGVTAVTSLFIWAVRRLRGDQPVRSKAIDSRGVAPCRNRLCQATNPASANFCRRCGQAMASLAR